ncbi:hypothetical protein EV360DRAFT_89817 [Lentinula raphanica]|nr:hypothetical protein EV360DRAFT_89817 [Lentinula raphanica]
MADVESLNETMGPAFIGMTVASLLLGISSIQAYIFFTTSSDSRPLRYLVGLVVLFDFVHQALITHTLYFYLILNQGKAVVLNLAVWQVQFISSTNHRGAEHIRRSLLVEIIINGFTAFFVQRLVSRTAYRRRSSLLITVSFLTWRIWRLSNYNIWITGVVTAIVLAEFGCVIAFGIIALVRARTFVELASDLERLSVTVNAFAAAGDILITATLAWLLQSSKTGFRRLDAILNKLTIFAINAGALTSLVALGSLISLLAAPNTFFSISFFFCMGRLYTNSLLASLNTRKKIRGEGDNVQSTNCHTFSFQANRLTRPSSFISFAYKKRRGQSSSIQIDTQPEYRMRTYCETSMPKNKSKDREEYKLGMASANERSHAYLESIAGFPVKPSEAHCNAVRDHPPLQLFCS